MRQMVDYSRPGKQTGHPTTNERRPMPAVRGVFAVVGAAASVAFLAGCGDGDHLASVTVSVSKNPFGVAVDTGTRTAYVTNSGDNTVSVIDSSTHTVTATVPVGKSRRRFRVELSWCRGAVRSAAGGTVPRANPAGFPGFE